MTTVINPKYINDNNIKAFVNDLPDKFDEKGTIIYKDRNIVKKYILENASTPISVIVKRYKKNDFFKKIIYTFFRKSKAQRAYTNATTLQERGINTPANIAYIEDFKFGLLTYCYYISEEDNSPSIAEKLTEEQSFDKTFASDFAQFIAYLHKKNIIHCDLNSTNVLYGKKEDGHNSFSLIDINRMCINPVNKPFSEKKYYNNLTLFSEDGDMFDYILRKYLEFTGKNTEQNFFKGKKIKQNHDRHWRQKKNFLKIFKPHKQ